MFKDSFIEFYMGMAQYIAKAKNSCPSRQVGAVIVDPKINKVIATGYNGPPKDAPSNDSNEWWNSVLQNYVYGLDISEEQWYSYRDNIIDCNVCPRKVLGIESGQRLDLCNCAHAEQNAIATASCNLHECYMFAFCPLPCLDCSKMIVNSGIKRLYYLKGPDYSLGARLILQSAKVELIELDYIK